MDGQPLPDLDHLALGEVTHRIRTLERPDVEATVEHERQHANRPAVLQVLEARLRELDEGAEPTGGSSQAPTPPPPEGGSAVGPETQGPVVNPPSQGVPTNPAQPRSTG
ncbi:hypothetical protein [Thalassiella azotivora]